MTTYSSSWGDIYNFPKKQFESVMEKEDEEEKELEEEDESDMEFVEDLGEDEEEWEDIDNKDRHLSTVAPTRQVRHDYVHKYCVQLFYVFFVGFHWIQSILLLFRQVVYARLHINKAFDLQVETVEVQGGLMDMEDLGPMRKRRRKPRVEVEYEQEMDARQGL